MSWQIWPSKNIHLLLPPSDSPNWKNIIRVRSYAYPFLKTYTVQHIIQMQNSIIITMQSFRLYCRKMLWSKKSSTGILLFKTAGSFKKQLHWEVEGRCSVCAPACFKALHVKSSMLHRPNNNVSTLFCSKYFIKKTTVVTFKLFYLIKSN